MIQDIIKTRDAHYESTKPMDEYFTGFYNGLECALCLAEKREPIYKDIEKPTRRQSQLETLISGHMEAMRPLLSEWHKLANPPQPTEQE